MLGFGAAAPAFSAAVGQAPIWVRCRACGHEWSAPSRAQRQQQADADLERRFQQFEEHQQRLLEELERRRRRERRSQGNPAGAAAPGEEGPA